MSIIKSTDETYKKILEENKLVLVDFWAPWCSPCIQLSPILEQIDKELQKVRRDHFGCPNHCPVHRTGPAVRRWTRI